MRHCAPIAIGPALTGGAMTPDAISGTVMQQTDPRGPVLHHQRLAMRHTFVWVRVHLVWSTYRRHPWIEPTWQERLYRRLAGVARRKGAVGPWVGGGWEHGTVDVS